MKSSNTPLGRSAQKIVVQIEKVNKAAEKAAKSKRRFADYRYLRSVLSAYLYFEESDLLHHLTEIAPSVLVTPVRASWHPLRVIIEATCTQPDLKLRSRWTRALQHAVAAKIEPKQLLRFIRANGGIAGCADLASKTQSKWQSARLARAGISDTRRPRSPYCQSTTRVA